MFDVADPELLYIFIAVVVGFIAGWLLWRSIRRPRIEAERRDHLAEHEVPTQGTFARVSQGPIPPAHEAPAVPRHDPVPAKGATSVNVGDAEAHDPAAPPKGATRIDVYDDGLPDDADAAETPVVPGRDGPEGNDVASEAAAATADVVGQFFGVNTHEALAGEDDLQTMKGVGPKLAAILRAEGLMRFEQIAALTPDEVSALDAKLGAFKGRLARDRVVEQAGYLARADHEGYERAFGKL